jgi:hypothetical protein
MKLVDFLIRLLEAQAQTLQRLAALFGEDILVEMLETAADDVDGLGEYPVETGWFSGQDVVSGGRSPYAELDGCVRELALAPPLQFHLWAYPVYRSFIESDLELGARVIHPQPAIDAALSGARAWLQTLPIPPELRNQAASAAEVPWIRFRSSLLKDLGQRPVGVV